MTNAPYLQFLNPLTFPCLPFFLLECMPNSTVSKFCTASSSSEGDLYPVSASRLSCQATDSPAAAAILHPQSNRMRKVSSTANNSLVCLGDDRGFAGFAAKRARSGQIEKAKQKNDGRTGKTKYLLKTTGSSQIAPPIATHQRRKRQKMRKEKEKLLLCLTSLACLPLLRGFFV